ncbi:hypothetical protein AWZ03_007072 [Drosophila navojoa]|uniref:Uncharacterized protein n=1 Tax=Drosophila navojoa TaxID=7232 RepID=A0A484BFH8_DRONA|nr:hypothetical protein AWZ03_007072 [Drosophila navojoa]
MPRGPKVLKSHKTPRPRAEAAAFKLAQLQNFSCNSFEEATPRGMRHLQQQRQRQRRRLRLRLQQRQQQRQQLNIVATTSLHFALQPEGVSSGEEAVGLSNEGSKVTN